MSTNNKTTGPTKTSPRKAQFVANPVTAVPVPTPPLANDAAMPPPAPVTPIPVVPVLQPKVVAPAAPAPVVPATVTPISKDIPMATAYNPTPQTVTHDVAQHAEAALTQGKAAYEQAAMKAKEAVEKGMKSIEDYNVMARENLEAMMASSKIATKGLETIGQHVAEVSKKNFEATVAAMKSMTTVKTPNELMQLQSDFAKTQFESAVTEFSKLSETVVKLVGDIVEPISNRVAVTVDKMGKNVAR